MAAALCAFYPELVWFSVHFWVENVFLVLLWWAFERLLASDATGSRGAAIAAGFLWGLAILARETGLYFLPVAAAWMVWRATHREGALAARRALRADDAADGRAVDVPELRRCSTRWCRSRPRAG